MNEYENGIVIERGINEKAMESVTLKKDSKGNIVWEIKAYGLDIEEAMEKALKIKQKIEAALAPEKAVSYEDRPIPDTDEVKE